MRSPPSWWAPAIPESVRAAPRDLTHFRRPRTTCTVCTFRTIGKLTHKLTLNLGFRYDIQMPPTARHNKQAYFDLHALNPISVTTGIPVYGQIVYNTPGNRGLYQKNLNDLAPRIGFAYALMPKLVMRGGYGIYYVEKLLWRQWTGPRIFDIVDVDFLGRRNQRDFAPLAGIPIGTCAGYRELARRPDQAWVRAPAS